MPIALLALTAGAFGIGTTEFVIMGLLLQVSADLHVGIAAAGLLISGYALGVAIGAPLLTIATRRLPRKTVLLALMAIFTLGNLACALAPQQWAGRRGSSSPGQAGRSAAAGGARAVAASRAGREAAAAGEGATARQEQEPSRRAPGTARQPWAKAAA